MYTSLYLCLCCHTHHRVFLSVYLSLSSLLTFSLSYLTKQTRSLLLLSHPVLIIVWKPFVNICLLISPVYISLFFIFVCFSFPPSGLFIILLHKVIKWRMLWTSWVLESVWVLGFSGIKTKGRVCYVKSNVILWEFFWAMPTSLRELLTLLATRKHKLFLSYETLSDLRLLFFFSFL